MKKCFYILWAALTMAGVFTACTNEDSPMTEQNELKIVTIRATIDGDLGSRVALTDDAKNRVVKVGWAAGDAFKINVNGTDYIFTYTEDDKFECADASFPETFDEAGTVIATYPATAPTACTSQSGTLDGAASLLTMTATLDVTAEQSTADLALNFKHNNSIVKMTLSNDDFKGKNVTWVTLKSGNSVVATTNGTFTDDAENGSVVAYFTVEPQTMADITVLAVCGENNYTVALTDRILEAGKLYNVNKKMAKVPPMGEKTATQAVKGDFAMADGTFISKDATLTAEQKNNVRGIVFWTLADKNTAADAKTSAKLTDDEIMAKDFPNCSHGLIVSLKDVSQETKWQFNVDSKINSWQNSDAFNADNKNEYKSIGSTVDSGDFTQDLINYILGYQNTKILKAYNAQCETAQKVLPVSLLADFYKQNPAPANTTGWFIPSVKELTLLYGVDKDNVYTNGFGNSTKTEMNEILTSLGTDCADILRDDFYWSSSEDEEYIFYAFSLNFYNGSVVDIMKNERAYYVRAVCAF